MSLKIITDESSLLHDPGRPHPENASRLRSLLDWASNREGITLERSCEPATKEQICSVHDEKLYQLIERSQGRGAVFDADTGANEHSFNAALHAAGASIRAFLEATPRLTTFAMIRPPGHHATAFRPMGFCLFNNIAIATQCTISSGRAGKVAIIDIDHHYGNGTAEIFWERKDVLYVSTHADPHYAYPLQGFLDDVGSDEGRGYNICLPMPSKSGDAEYKLAFDEIIDPIVCQFNPDVIGVSVGFDAYEMDRIGILALSGKGFRLLGNRIFQLSKELNVPVAQTLEGGYNVKALPGLAEEYFRSFIERAPAPVEFQTTARGDARSMVAQSKAILASYWRF
jgi:acetoin utilization deacetylase AcuC-like enzyme